MVDLTELRYRYEDRTGRAIWLRFDPAFLCVYCERPVGNLSFGGPAVCPSCDCGYTDGVQWNFKTHERRRQNAIRRFDNMPSDPAWEEYEKAHKQRAAAR